MNHFFYGITWIHYAELLALALVFYYLYVGLRWYRAEVSKFLRVGTWRSAGSFIPQASETQRADELANDKHPEAQGVPISPGELETLARALLTAIADSGARPYAPEATVKRLKAIIGCYPELRNSSQRAAINSVVVTECKKTGIAQLSEQDVDEWWQA